MLAPVVASSRVPETIDQRLMRCGTRRRAFSKFCSSPMIAESFVLAITDMKTSEAPAQGRWPGGRSLAGSGPLGGGKKTTCSSQTDPKDNL